MEHLAKWIIVRGNEERTIELLRGSLAELPPEHAVDLLVVSAFANDYIPTPASLIGSLYSEGVSVEDLAHDKEVDLREQFSCWLSRRLPAKYAFRQIICIESGWRGSPPEITDDLFRALAPYLITSLPNAAVAMPVMGAGDQGWPVAQMLESILNTAVSWINRGLPLRILKIVVRSEVAAIKALEKFREVRDRQSEKHAARATMGPLERAGHEYDIFMSYSHKDLGAARAVVKEVLRLCPKARVFHDKENIRSGESWLMQIAESLDNSKRVAALYTPTYWTSPYCRDEFTAALARQNDTGTKLLFPIHFLHAEMPYLFRNLQFADCREGDAIKLLDASRGLVESLSR